MAIDYEMVRKRTDNDNTYSRRVIREYPAHSEPNTLSSSNFTNIENIHFFLFFN